MRSWGTKYFLDQIKMKNMLVVNNHASFHELIQKKGMFINELDMDRARIMSEN